MNRSFTKLISECLSSGKVGTKVNDYAATLGDELADGGRPMPREPPVTSVVLPVKSIIYLGMVYLFVDMLDENSTLRRALASVISM